MKVKTPLPQSQNPSQRQRKPSHSRAPFERSPAARSCRRLSLFCFKQLRCDANQSAQGVCTGVMGATWPNEDKMLRTFRSSLSAESGMRLFRQLCSLTRSHSHSPLSLSLSLPGQREGGSAPPRACARARTCCPLQGILQSVGGLASAGSAAQWARKESQART